MNRDILEVAGIRIAEPFEKLRTKFGFGSDNVPFALYDGYRTPAERDGDANILEMEDLLITVAMNSRIGAAAMTAFWNGIHHKDSWYVNSGNLLAQLPPDQHLADISDDRLSSISQLFIELEDVKGVKTAIAAKILCRKRPRSIPMLDAYVLPFCCHLSLESEGRTELTGPPWARWRDSNRALRFLRQTCQEARDQLGALCNSFRNLEGSPDLSPLRALESLLWWELWQKQGTDARVGRFRKLWGLEESA